MSTPIAFRKHGSLRLPFAGELQGALADGVADGLVGRDGVEPFGLGLVLVTQEVNQTQCLTLRSQLQCVMQFLNFDIAEPHRSSFSNKAELR